MAKATAAINLSDGVFALLVINVEKYTFLDCSEARSIVNLMSHEQRVIEAMSSHRRKLEQYDMVFCRYAFAPVCPYEIRLFIEWHHRLDRSSGKAFDPRNGGKVVVPVRATGATDMRVRSHV